jgi:GTP-binding protein
LKKRELKIKNAIFLKSTTDYLNCPNPTLPEYAFIGRSNVGKSSLINTLTGSAKLAKTSSTPGKTQLINHFLINEEWYLVDLPGYGFAKIGKETRKKWDKMIQDYLKYRENLQCVLVLIDSRIKPQASDLKFMEWLAISGIPFVMVFTKEDKQTRTKTLDLVKQYKKEMEQFWEEIPQCFITSSETREGKEEILRFIEEINVNFTLGKN